MDKLVREKNLGTLILMENELVQGTFPSKLVSQRYSEFGWGKKVVGL